jgi:hypothetical protein
MERQLNSIDQTGPIGKVIMMKLTTEMLDLLRENKLTVFIDDPVTGSADGYAIDFVKLLVNLRKFQYYGNVRGLIIDDEDGKGIDNAVIRIAEFGETRSFNGGNFTLNNIPAGLAVVTGEAPGYASAAVTVDVITGETSEEILIKLRRSKTVEFTGKSFREGESVVMKNI